MIIVNKLLYNGEESFYNFISKLHKDETIIELNCYVGYSNFFTIWKIIEIFKDTNKEVELNFYFSKNISKDFIIDENYFYENKNDEYINIIPYEIFNSISSYVLFNRQKNNNTKIKVHRIESTKTIKNKGKIFHGKLYEIKTESDSYLIIGSSNLTYTGLGINSFDNKDYFCNEINYIVKKDNSNFDKWKNDFLDSYKNLDSINALLEDYKSIAFKDLIKYIYNKENFIDDESNNLLSLFFNNSEIKKELKGYQLQTLKKIITCLFNFGGAVLNYDVGLGKTHIGLAIYDLFKNFANKRVKIVVPPGLKNEWISYKQEFPIPLRHIENDVLSQTSETKLIDNCEVLIIDEAHNYRNKDTKKRFDLIKNFFDQDYSKDDGKKFKRENKIVLLITATPYNNSPDDLQNLIDLFGERSTSNKEKFKDIKSIWSNKRFTIFDSKKSNVNDEEIKKFILFFFNRLNKKSNRFNGDESVEYFFPRIAFLGDQNLNPVVVEDKEFVDVYGKEKIKNFNKVYNEIFDRINEIIREKLFTLDADSLLRNNLLISLDSSLQAFQNSFSLIIQRLKENIKLYTNDPESYENNYKYRKNKKNTDYIEEDFFDDDEDLSWYDEDTNSDKYFYPVEFIKRYKDKEMIKKIDTIDLWINNYIKDNITLDKTIEIKYQYMLYLFQKIKDFNKRKTIIFCSRISTVDDLCKKLSETNFINENDAIISASSKQIKIFFKNGKYEIIDLSINDAKTLVKRLFSPLCNKDNGNKKINEKYEKYKNYNYKFLISTNVFAEGHNIQDATVLINFDNHYNPMVIMQRIGRVDRFRDYKKIYTDDIYKNVYVFSLWTNKKIVNATMHQAVNKKTRYADILGSDTHKYYIEPKRAYDYIEDRENFALKQHNLLSDEINDEIATYNFRNYTDWFKAKEDIEKHTPQYLIYKNKENALIYILESDDEKILILYVDKDFNIFLNKNYNKDWILNDTESIENSKIEYDKKYLMWLKRIKEEKIISKFVEKNKHDSKNIYIKKIIYLIGEE